MHYALAPRTFLFSHYFATGLRIATGIIGLTFLTYFLADLRTAVAVAMGALCTSLMDMPSPLRHKFNEMLAGVLLCSAVALLVSLCSQVEWLLVSVIVLVSFLASMMVVYGRKAMPLQFAALFVMMLSSEAPSTPLQALRDSLFFSANTVDQEGRYVFSGTRTSTAPMAYDATQPAGSRYSYAGNTNEQRVVVGNGLTQVANDNVKGMEQLLNRLDATIDALGSATLDVSAPATRAVLTANLDGFDDALDLVSSKIAVLGGKQNILDTLDANHGNVSLSNQMAITDIGQLDMGLAATELNGYSTALQATYKAYGRIGTLSLFSAL